MQHNSISDKPDKEKSELFTYKHDIINIEA